MKKNKPHHLDEDLPPIEICKDCHQPFVFQRCYCKHTHKTTMRTFKNKAQLYCIEINGEEISTDTSATMIGKLITQSLLSRKKSSEPIAIQIFPKTNNQYYK